MQTVRDPCLLAWVAHRTCVLIPRCLENRNYRLANQQVGYYISTIIGSCKCTWANRECCCPDHPRRVCTLRDWVEALWPLLCTDDDLSVTINVSPLVEVDKSGVVVQVGINWTTNSVCAPEALLRELEQWQHDMILGHQTKCSLDVVGTLCGINFNVCCMEQV